MILLSLDWTGIWESVIANSIVGVFIGGLGYLIWIIKHSKKKKQEAYYEMMPIIYESLVYLRKSYKTELSEKELKRVEMITRPENQKYVEKFSDAYGRNYGKAISELMLLLTQYAHNLEDKPKLKESHFNEYVNSRINKIHSVLKKKYKGNID